MAKPTRTEIGLLILAGIGAGTLIGATVGLLLGRRAASPDGAAMAGSVDELKEKAEHVLDELSGNVSELVGRSRQMLAEPPRPAEPAAEQISNDRVQSPASGPGKGEHILNLTMNSRTPNETTCVLEIEGEVDVYTAPQLKQDIVQIAEGGVKHLIINLAKVEYLDSTGLGVLIGGLKRLRESEGNLVLVGPGMRILRIFEITGLDKIFDIYASEEEAAAKEGVSL